MKKTLSCLLLVFSILLLVGCQKSSQEQFGYTTEPTNKDSNDAFLSMISQYRNDLYLSLFTLNGETYGRIISSADSSEDAIAVCTRHFTDNRYPVAINTVTKCEVIYESDILYGIHVQWQVTNNGVPSGQYEENVISFKKDVADITVRNVVYDDIQFYKICTDVEEQVEQIILYLFYSEHLGQNILEYELVSTDNEYTITIYSFVVCYGDWGVKDEYNLNKFTIVVNQADGSVYFEGPTVLQTVFN